MQLCEQLPAAGQPIHLTPFFFSFIIYITADPTIIRSITITIKFTILITPHIINYAVFFKEYCASNFLSAFFTKQTTTATIATTAISPGTKPAPSVPAVTNVPI